MNNKFKSPEAEAIIKTLKARAKRNNRAKRAFIDKAYAKDSALHYQTKHWESRSPNPKRFVSRSKRP